MLFWIVSIAIGLYLGLEMRRFAKARSQIPIRIHVYGTRGKTSATRALFDVLRNAGWTVVAKTTGDLPQLFLPDGSVQTLKRWGPARIHEYLKCIYKASRYPCDAIVFECMALAPESIVMAQKILSPTHVVITNTRPDHHESMGVTPEAIAQTLALSVGDGCVTFASLDEQAHWIQKQSIQKKGIFIGVPYESEQPPLWHAHQLIKAVTRQLNVPTPPEPVASWPVFKRYHIEPLGHFQFLDLFSTNDVVSSKMLLQKALAQLALQQTLEPLKPVVALLATRSDRPLRTKAFIDWFAQNPQFTHYINVGWHHAYSYIQMRQQGLNTLLPNFNPMPDSLELLSRIQRAVGGDFILVGLGNMHGYGEKFHQFLSKES